MNDGRSIFHSGQRGANEGVRSEQEMIAMVSAARVAEIMHGGSSFEILAKRQVDSADATRIPEHWQHLPESPIPWDCG